MSYKSITIKHESFGNFGHAGETRRVWVDDMPERAPVENVPEDVDYEAVLDSWLDGEVNDDIKRAA